MKDEGVTFKNILPPLQIQFTKHTVFQVINSVRTMSQKFPTDRLGGLFIQNYTPRGATTLCLLVD